jgi:hypothetical protein
MPYPAKEYAEAFLKHRQPLLALLEQIPVEHSDFAIREGALSFIKPMARAIGIEPPMFYQF